MRDDLAGTPMHRKLYVKQVNRVAFPRSRDRTMFAPKSKIHALAACWRRAFLMCQTPSVANLIITASTSPPLTQHPSSDGADFPYTPTTPQSVQPDNVFKLAPYAIFPLQPSLKGITDKAGHGFTATQPQTAPASNTSPVVHASATAPLPVPVPTNADGHADESSGDEAETDGDRDEQDGDDDGNSGGSVLGSDNDSDGDEDGDGNSENSSRESDYDSDGESVDEIDKAHERNNRLYELDEDGVLQWKRNESSYTYAELHRRGESRQDLTRTFMYDLASSQDLRKYVLRRGLPDPYPQGLTMKYLYLRLLETADRDTSFRFLDLPPELRNAIYANLLTFKRCTHCPRIHEFCHTTIFRANKQVCKEAKEILYAENEIQCFFSASGFDDGSTDFFSIVHANEMRSTNNSMDLMYLGMSQIPHWFRNIQCLRIRLDFDGGFFDTAHFKLQACLLNLASFLMDEHCLKKLTVEIRDVWEAEPEEREAWENGDIAAKLASILYPLRRLRGVKKVIITGVSDSAAKDTIAEMHNTSKPAFNTLQHFYHVRNKADAYLKMMASLMPYGHVLGEGLFHEGCYVHEIKAFLTELGDFEAMCEFYNPFETEEVEANTRRKMEDLRDCLTKVKLDDFEQRLNGYRKALKDSREYFAKVGFVYVDGKRKKKVRGGPRHDWISRMEDEDW